MPSSALRKRESLIICSAIPAFIPRQLALDVLHNHEEVITLNPLVTHHVQIQPPHNAPPDERLCIWYEITERIQYVPGLGKMGSGKISFNGCFHDQPWGLQTHIYAPMSVDMRANYRIAGNQPGTERRNSRELGLQEAGAPADGLYLRADLEFESNIALVSFIRSQMKTAIKDMVSRIVKRAESLDADVLESMIRSSKLAATTPSTYSGAYEPAMTQSTAKAQSYEPTPYHQQVPFKTFEPAMTERTSQSIAHDYTAAPPSKQVRTYEPYTVDLSAQHRAYDSRMAYDPSARLPSAQFDSHQRAMTPPNSQYRGFEPVKPMSSPQPPIHELANSTQPTPYRTYELADTALTTQQYTGYEPYRPNSTSQQPSFSNSNRQPGAVELPGSR